MPANENTGSDSAVITKGSSMEEYLLFLIGPMDCWMWELLMEERGRVDGGVNCVINADRRNS